MAYYFPEGSSQQFASAFAAAKTITAVTNANPAVAASPGHGYVNGDEILLSSGWEDATDTVYTVEAVDANSYKILGLDTSNTNFFAAGAGVGSAKKISGWTAIPQVISINTSGGGPRYTEFQLLAKRNSIKVPTGFNAQDISLTLAHDPALAAYKALVAVSRALTPVAFKQAVSGGAVTYGYGYISVSEFPKLQSNNVNSVEAAMTLIGRAISY